MESDLLNKVRAIRTASKVATYHSSVSVHPTYSEKNCTMFVNQLEVIAENHDVFLKNKDYEKCQQQEREFYKVYDYWAENQKSLTGMDSAVVKSLVDRYKIHFDKRDRSLLGWLLELFFPIEPRDVSSYDKIKRGF